MKYSLLRTFTIGLQTIMLPFGTFVGYEFGARDYLLALLALTVQTLLTIVQGHVWWLTLERNKSKN